DAGHRFKSRSLNITGTPPGTTFQRSWTYHYRTNAADGPLHAPRALAFNVNDVTQNTSFDYDDVGRMTRICSGESEQDPRTCSLRSVENQQRAGLLSNRAMTWDAEGRLISVRGVKDPAVPVNEDLLREDYVYDAGGNRALKIHRSPRPDNLSPGER